jgi:hypothetical protein
MAWVHLVHNFIVLPGPLASIVRDHTRFAAGAFIFLAGWSVASAFGEALQRGSADARAVRWRLWRRAVLPLMLDHATRGEEKREDFQVPVQRFVRVAFEEKSSPKRGAS